MSDNDTYNDGTLQTAIIEPGDEMPCPVGNIVNSEKFGVKSLVVWYVEMGEADTYTNVIERDYMTTFAHHQCREKDVPTLAIDDSSDKLRCAECGSFCKVPSETERNDLDRVVGHLEGYYEVRSDGVAHFEGLESGKYALVRFDECNGQLGVDR